MSPDGHTEFGRSGIELSVVLNYDIKFWKE
jgi:hypothetical protein